MPSSYTLTRRESSRSHAVMTTYTDISHIYEEKLIIS